MTSRIVETTSRLLIPFILLFGVYIISYGHISPGGGFQGGVILAMAVLLGVIILGVHRFQKFIPYITLLELLGVTLFILIGMIGITSGKQFLSNIGSIPLLNIIIGFKVFAGIILIFIFLIVWESKND